MELALGTVQFGLAYGVAGAGKPVPESEARAILAQAWALGIRTLDTAPAYGDIEERLAGLAGQAPFSVITKLPALPLGLDDDAAAAWLAQSLERSSLRLGERLRGVLFHHADDLLGPRGAHLWEVAARIAKTRGVPLGASCYQSQTLAALQARFPLQLAQLPANAFDQGLRHWDAGADAPQIHIRSAFLQGLLLLPQEVAAAKVPKAAPALARWHAWCGKRGLAPLQAALSVVKGFPGASHCVVGVDHADQLEAIARAWDAVHPLEASELATPDAEVIDPRRWPAREAV